MDSTLPTFSPNILVITRTEFIEYIIRNYMPLWDKYGEDLQNLIRAGINLSFEELKKEVQS